MDDPKDRSGSPRPRARAPRRPRSASRVPGFVVADGVDVPAGFPGAPDHAVGHPGTVAIPENQITLILVYNGDQHVIGEGQLRNVDISTDNEFRDFGFSWDTHRSFAPTGIRHITISLEVDTRGTR